MADAVEIESRIRELHAARLRGDVAGMCRAFSDNARFQIAGASDGKPISIDATGIKEFKPWLAMMAKAFRLSDYTLLSLIVDSPRAAAHWRVQIHSKITGKSVPTELVDLIEVQGSRITAYTEFFVPR